jgi:hypothetical protein
MIGEKSELLSSKPLGSIQRTMRFTFYLFLFLGFILCSCSTDSGFSTDSLVTPEIESAVMFQATNNSPPEDREDYSELDVDEGVGSNYFYPPFKDFYEKAVVADSAWIKFPDRIALKITGYPDPELPDPEIALFQISEEKVIAIVTVNNVMDDSVYSVQYRVEMSKDGNHWKVDWFGSRVKCRRGHEDWGTELCN